MESKKQSLIESLVTPDPSMNYNFLTIVFGILSLLSILFFALEKYAVADSIHGFWIVPAPCLPCYLYCLFLRSRVISPTASAVVKSKDQ